MTTRRAPPTFIPVTPISKPRITCPAPTVSMNGVRPGTVDESNCRPLFSGATGS